MLASYSWGEFFTFLLIGLCIYYVFVAFFYYGEDLNKIISGEKEKKLVPTVALADNSSHTNSFSPIIAENISAQSYKLDEDRSVDVDTIAEEQPEVSSIENANILVADTYDWENTKEFSMDYRDATPEEEILLNDIDVAEPENDEELEGGVPADDYLDTIIEIQKENIDVEKEEVTKSALRRSYFNSTMVDLYKTNETAKANIDAMLTNLTAEKKITLGELADFDVFVNKASCDDDIQTLLSTLNNQ